MIFDLSTMSIRALSFGLNSHPSLRPHTFWKKRTWSSITPTQTGITIHSLNNTTFPYIWLRDSCQSPSSVHPSTKQKLHKTSDISKDIRPVSLDQRGLRVNESGELEINWIDGHKSIYSRSFLEVHSDEEKLHRFHHDLTRNTWDNKSIQKSDLFIPYGSIRTPSGLLQAIDQLVKYGILFVTGVPNQDTGDETCELRKLGESFGELRSTFYGMVWDVVNRKESKNIAYTNLDLGLHMDLL